MTETAIFLDLLLYRPQAYVLLSFLHLLAEKRGYNPFTFIIKDIRPIAGRTVLTKEQVRRNLALLHEREFILVEKVNHCRTARDITLLKRGFIHG